MAVCVALGAYLDGKLSASGEVVWYYIVFLSVLVVRAGGFLAPGTQMGSEGVRGSHRGHAGHVGRSFCVVLRHCALMVGKGATA